MAEKIKPSKSYKKYINLEPETNDGVLEDKEFVNPIKEAVGNFVSDRIENLEEASIVRKRHHMLFTKDGKVKTDRRFNLYKLKKEDREYFEDLFNLIEAVHKRFQDDPYNREWGTDSLTAIYKHDTPGQTNEVSVRMADGKLKRITNVPIRMASGEIKSLPPGKSGSSGGGGCGG